jgi:hypothetical protein
MIWNMMENQMLKPLRVLMIIISGNDVVSSIIANVVEASERGTIYKSYSIIWDKKLLLPSHENVIFVMMVITEIIAIEFILIRDKSGKTRPVLSIHLFVCFPFTR